MKKSVYIISILFLFFSQMAGIKLSDPRIKQVQRNWELVKTVPLTEYIVDPLNYKLVTQTNPDQLMLRDKQGNVLWTKTNLERYSNEVIIDDTFYFSVGDISEDEATNSPEDSDYDDDYFPYDGEFPTNRIAAFGEFIDKNGNCLLTDKTNSSFVWVDKTGKEMYLPIESDNWIFVGTALDKYLVFTIIADRKLRKQCAIFDKQGTKLKQFYLPDQVETWQGDVFIDDNAKYLAYRKTEPEGYTLLSTKGQVIRTQSLARSGISVYEPVFSQDSNLWIPRTSCAEDFTILDIKTGGRVFTLNDTYSCQAAISNRSAGYILITNVVGVQVLDYVHKQCLFKQNNDNAEFREPWISGDGKEIRFTYQEKGKHSEVRYYRLK